MKFKKIIMLVIIIGSSTGTVLQAEETFPKDKPGTAVFVMSLEKKDKIMVTTDFVEEEKGHLKIDLKIPVMNNFKKKDFKGNLIKK